MWWTNKSSKLRRNTRRKLRLALRQSGPDHWKSYREAQHWYRWVVRQAKVISFCETINKIPELTRLRKIQQRTGELRRNH